MDAFAYLAEQKIQEALARGDLDNLPDKGRPLQLEDLSGLSAELRSTYLVLRGAGCLSEGVDPRRVMGHDLLQEFGERDDGRRRATTANALRYRRLMESRDHTEAHLRYAAKIQRRLGR